MSLIFCAASVACGHKNENANLEPTFEDSCKFVNALDLRIINKGFDNSEKLFWRLPAYLKDSVRPTLWDYQKHSAGMAVCFRTNSSYIGIKYKLLMDFKVSNMAFTAVKGTDLYIHEGDSVWRYVNTSKPEKDGKEFIVKPFVRNLDTSRISEYMIYLPLYDGVESMEIGVSPDAIIESGNPELFSKNRIVAYGTSIMQGGCASRTGMAATNILSRELDCEVINLGFSGQGMMDYEVARAMATIPDVSCYIVDPVPNCDVAMCDTLTYGFVRILLDSHPDVPVVMVSNPQYPHSRQDHSLGRFIKDKNDAFYRNYQHLTKEYPNVYYVEGLDIADNEDDYGTVDGVHLSNLGFRRYADTLKPLLRSILNR